MAGKPHPRTSLFDLEFLEDYYRRHSIPSLKSDCVEWSGGMHRQGYGMCGAWRKSDNKKIMTVAHRIAARLKFQRAISSDEFIVHTCSNPRCVNEDHLILGDRSTIHAVMKQNGRPTNAGRKKGSRDLQPRKARE